MVVASNLPVDVLLGMDLYGASMFRASPIVLVQEIDEGVCFCVDFRKLN